METREQKQKASTATSAAEPATVGFPTRTTSEDCGHSWTQSDIRGEWMPASCPICHPPRDAVRQGSPAPAPGYQGDILADLDAAGVNVREYRDATLDTFDASDDPEALERAHEYVDAWFAQRGERYARRDWMYLYGAGSKRAGRTMELGKTGNGKTFLAVAIARRLIEANALAPRRFVFASAEQILLESEATFRANADDSESRLIRRYAAPDLLVIDDIGVRDLSPHAIRVFDEITKKREANGTIWTSNLSIAVLKDGAEFMKRITSRIAGQCGDGARYVVKFDGRERRLERSRRTAA